MPGATNGTTEILTHVLIRLHNLRLPWRYMECAPLTKFARQSSLIVLKFEISQSFVVALLYTYSYWIYLPHSQKGMNVIPIYTMQTDTVGSLWEAIAMGRFRKQD